MSKYNFRNPYNILMYDDNGIIAIINNKNTEFINKKKNGLITVTQHNIGPQYDDKSIIKDANNNFIKYVYIKKKRSLKNYLENNDTKTDLFLLQEVHEGLNNIELDEFQLNGITYQYTYQQTGSINNLNDFDSYNYEKILHGCAVVWDTNVFKYTGNRVTFKKFCDDNNYDYANKFRSTDCIELENINNGNKYWVLSFHGRIFSSQKKILDKNYYIYYKFFNYIRTKNNHIIGTDLNLDIENYDNYTEFKKIDNNIKLLDNINKFKQGNLLIPTPLITYNRVKYNNNNDKLVDSIFKKILKYTNEQENNYNELVQELNKIKNRFIAIKPQINYNFTNIDYNNQDTIIDYIFSDIPIQDTIAFPICSKIKDYKDTLDNEIFLNKINFDHSKLIYFF